MDKIGEVKKILENNTISWYREDKEAWIENVAKEIHQLFEEDEKEETVKLPQVVGRGGEANE